MKGTLSEGVLQVERDGILQTMHCPYTCFTKPCKDLCPHLSISTVEIIKEHKAKIPCIKLTCGMGTIIQLLPKEKSEVF